MKKVIDYLTNSLNLTKKDIIVVGVSTGPDSMVLLHLLMELEKKYHFKIIVAHVNHNKRRESKNEAKYLEDFCLSHNLLFEYMKIEKYGDDNFQNEARYIRYRFFESLIKKYHANYLMTAHHGDDLMETILMRIVRGSSLRGYSGFSLEVNKGDYKIIRPLIFVTKEDIENYAKNKNIRYFFDRSNGEDNYTRNRYRHVVLPFLKKEETRVHEKFYKFSKLLEDCDIYLTNVAKKEINHVYKDGMINVELFLKLPNVIATRIVDYLYASIYNDDLMLIDDRHINLFFKLINSKKANLCYSLPNGYFLVKSYNNVYFKQGVDDLINYDLELLDYLLLPNGMKIQKISDCSTNGNDILRLNSRDILLPLHVRTRKNGDRMLTLNGGTKKVKDIFIEKKIPLAKRDLWPIVVDSNDSIVWIPLLKKSKYNRLKSDSCDIIFKCN